MDNKNQVCLMCHKNFKGPEAFTCEECFHAAPQRAEAAANREGWSYEVRIKKHSGVA